MTVEFCQKCSSLKIFYNEEFDFWTCETCGEHWSEGKNDPDYYEESPEALEAIAEQNIELINQWDGNLRDISLLPSYLTFGGCSEE